MVSKSAPIMIIFGVTLLLLVQSASALSNDGVLFALNFNGDVSDATGNFTPVNHGTSDTATAVIGDARQFDSGSSTWINMSAGMNDGLDFTNGFTFNVWVKTSTTSRNEIIADEDGSTGHLNFLLRDGDGDNFRVFYYTGSDAACQKDSPGIFDDVWHMISATWDKSSGDMKLYVDGSVVQTCTGVSSITDSGSPYGVGRRMYDSSPMYFNGLMDAFSAWGRALSDSEISELYNSGAGLEYPYTIFVNSSINASTYLVVDTNCTAWRNDTSSTCYTFNSTPTVTFSTLSNTTCAIGTTEENYTAMITDDPERNCTVTGGTSHECTVSQGDSFRWGSHPLYISCEAPDGTEDDPSSSGALNLWKNWTGILIHAHDEQDNNTLTGWTARINGSGYTNTSSDSSGWALFEGVSGSYTVNITKAGYWDAVNTYDIPVQDYEVNISMHQSEFTTTAEEIVTGYTMTDYDVWEDGAYLGKCSAALGCTWHSKSGTHTVTMGKVDVYGNPTYYNASSSVYMPPGGSNATHEVLHDAELHVNGTNAMTGVKILNYTLTTTLSSPSYTDNQTTSTGDVTVPLKQGYTYDVFINPAQYSNDEVNITVPSGNMTVYHTFILYSMNSFTITVYDEDTRQPLNGANQTVHVEIAGATSFNGTADGNASVYADLLTPGEYRITATADGYAQSDYYYHLYPKTHNFIDLYMLNSTEASYVNFVIEDNYGTTTPGTVVELLRYYPDIDYTVVRMAESSFDGVARLPLEPENVWYKLIILRNWTAYDITEPKKFASTDTSFTINVNFESSVLTSFYAFQQMQKSLTYNSDTGVFAFTWTDSSGLLDEACLKVSKVSFISDETVCDECSSATAGQLLCTINTSVEGEYSAIGKLETATKYSSDLTRLSEKVSNSLTTFGIGGVVVSVFVIGAVALLASGMIEASIALTLLGMVTLYLAGILVAVQTLIAGIVIIGIVILFTIKRRGGY